MNLEWHESIENILSCLGDESQIRSRLHMNQHLSYRKRNQLFTLPVVILSILAGSGNFISEGYDNPITKKYMILGIGVVSIICSIISSVSQFLKLAELSEGNKMASLAWGKYFSRIKFQLSLQRNDRESCHDYLVSIFSEYDRLYEISPILHTTFVSHIKKKLKNLPGVVLPYYLNGFNHTVAYNEDEQWEDNESDEKELV